MLKLIIYHWEIVIYFITKMERKEKLVKQAVNLIKIALNDESIKLLLKSIILSTVSESNSNNSIVLPTSDPALFTSTKEELLDKRRKSLNKSEVCKWQIKREQFIVFFKSLF